MKNEKHSGKQKNHPKDRYWAFAVRIRLTAKFI